MAKIDNKHVKKQLIQKTKMKEIVAFLNNMTEK
jgi:hypothetical protein